MIRNWKTHVLNQRLQKRLCESLGISPVLAQLLLNRNVKTPDAAKDFLFGDMSACHDPFLMKGMREAVERINKAIDSGEKILVYGDYDVDGVTSTALLYSVLKDLGADVGTFIPNRLEEGYGLNIRAVALAREKDVGLLITVDCGINSVNEVDSANKHGIDVIITDHHEVKSDERPEAFAIIDPHQEDCHYPYQFLAGVGVAYKLGIALARGREDMVEKHLDLVALGTVADIAPQNGENRILTKTGLRRLRRTSKEGLKAIMDIARIEPEKLTCRHIGFIIGPRINAMGRVGSANQALELLLCEDPERAKELAKLLDQENRNRQSIEKDILKHALDKAETDLDMDKQKVIVLADESWHPGVIGIVASRLTEEYGKPAILIALDDGVGKGSGRGVDGFNLFGAISASGEHLLTFGGHEQACGIKIEEDKVQSFRDAINKVADSYYEEEEGAVPEIMIDMSIPFSYIGMKLMKELELLPPYGPGNVEPVFATSGIKVRSRPRDIGRNGMKFHATCGTLTCEAVTFKKDIFTKPRQGDMIDLAYTPSINSWNGIDTIQLNIKDVKVN